MRQSPFLPTAIGALVTFVYLIMLGTALLRTPGFMLHGVMLALLLLVQAGLGIANVTLGLPLVVAVAHNGDAAALLVTLAVINFALTHCGKRTGAP